MANIFLNLPMPAGDGAGATVDTSAMGKDKSIVIGGLFKGASVIIEVSADGSNFQSVYTFFSAGGKVIPVAAMAMRVRVLGRSAEPFSATANVGANDTGALFFDLPVPAAGANGAGAAVDVSTLGNFTTFVVNREFLKSSIAIQISEDGVDYATVQLFADTGGVKSKVVVANFMRTFVQGRTGNTYPYTPIVAACATLDAGAGGGIGAAAETLINVVRLGEGESHDSDTPLIVAQSEFNPLDYVMTGTTRSLKFRAVAANGGGVASTNVRLYSVTDSETIATLNFTAATPTAKEVALVEGAGAGEIDLASKLYEVRIWVVAPDLTDDTIELGSAEIQVINTID